MDDLERLRASLQAAQDLNEPWGFFHDHMASSAAFMARGQPRHHARLPTMLGTIALRLYGGEGSVAVTTIASIHLEREGFWHGASSLPNASAIWFYFDGLGMGLAGWFRDAWITQVALTRLSVVPIERGAFVPRGPRGQA